FTTKKIPITEPYKNSLFSWCLLPEASFTIHKNKSINNREAMPAIKKVSTPILCISTGTKYIENENIARKNKEIWNVSLTKLRLRASLAQKDKAKTKRNGHPATMSDV